MHDQLRAIHGVLVHPRATFQALPAQRLWVLPILAPLYFALSRSFRPGTHEQLRASFGGDLRIVLVTVGIGLVMIPVGAWLIQQLLRLFKKRLSLIKLINIHGYAAVPRLVVALLGTLIVLADPSALSDQPSPTLIVLAALGVSAIFYTLILYTYGLIVCPSEGAPKQVQPARASPEI